uniref:Uncharacterized protein n=1 Tax=Amphimedon queenslandica TaxID=400682 RepID=A0A1X7V8A8_AMPQE
QTVEQYQTQPGKQLSRKVSDDYMKICNSWINIDICFTVNYITFIS